AESAVVGSAVRIGGLLVVVQTVVGCLAALGTVLSDDGFDGGAFAVPFLGVLLAVLAVLCVLLAWWIVVLPVVTIVRGAAGAVRGRTGPRLHVLFSLLLLEAVALAVTSSGHQQRGWPAWPVATALVAMVVTVAGLIAVGVRLARTRRPVVEV
ncbi:hypothetical protein ACFP8W_09295, partial [Nocardioides hankookensis]